MRFNRNKSKLDSPSKSRMSDKLLTEMIRRTHGEQILSVTLNQINNTRIHSRKQLGSCSALTIVRFNYNKSKMSTPQKVEWWANYLTTYQNNRRSREKKLILTPVILEV